MRHIKKNNIPEELYSMTVVIYGGGYTGRIIAELLISRGIKIKYIIDDNEGIQGTYVNKIKVISYREFCEYAGEQQVAVILTTIYGKAVLRKLDGLNNLQVYELYDWYSDVIGKEGVIEKITREFAKVQETKNQINILRDKWGDEESGRVLEGLMHFLDTKDLNDIADVCTESEQYFIPEVLELVQSPCFIVDGGAYQGELLQALKNNNIDFERWYCFEADCDNYELLLTQAEKNRLDKKQVCINKGLWSESGKLYFESKGTEGKIVSYKTDQEISVVSLDEYLGDEHCSFIKMDIEGAELPALMGGINLIKRERPVLAISIYHSLEDFWRIPQFLMTELEHYKYYVRHHSLIFCETVLYAIPDSL